MTKPEQARHRRHRQPRKGSVYAHRGTNRVGSVGCGSCGGRVFQHLIPAGLGFLVAAILVSPVWNDVAGMMGVEFGVLAAPCTTENTTAGGAGGGTGTFNVNVTPNTDLNLTSIFNCEGGQFEVVWSGAVNVSGTIHIGLGTTVTIVGDDSSRISSSTDTIPESISSSTVDSSNTSTSYDEVDDLTAMLSIPRDLTSAAVGVRPSEPSADTNYDLAFGPMFYVEGGQLFLKNMAIRGGYVVNSTSSPIVNGGGIHAHDSNVTAIGCEFEDNFAEFWGGGIFGNRSTLVIVNSVFRRCQAGFRVEADDARKDVAGGGIGAVRTNILIDGCLFEDCYASSKGGGMHQWIGQVSVLGSVFFNNSAGSNNAKDATEIGEGAALSFTECVLSFDGNSSCGVNGTIIADSHVGEKGGAVAIGSGFAPSHVEFHNCTVANSTTGLDIEDDEQGDGGAFVVNRGTRLVLADCVLKGNSCGNKAGVITLSSGEDWEVDPGATVILRNSRFESNKAGSGSSGVAYLAKFSALIVAGDGNEFEGNTCGENGGVFGGTDNTNITVEGGVFKNNVAKESGGVMWTEGKIEIAGGHFVDNTASEEGGVILSADGSNVTLAGGVFEGNKAIDGAVLSLGDDSNLLVQGGKFFNNLASNSGGVFSITGSGNVQITGGNFSSNEADFGGFLFKEGKGTASCAGASIQKNEGVDGGAIYADEDSELDWACDLKGNFALTGPAIYARDDTTVILRGVTLLDNTVARGSVIFVVDSTLKTYQVDFRDTKKTSDLSAVQVDVKSTYMAEDTSFDGFAGEAVVFSEGQLFLDDCDFSGSTASQLVYVKPNSTVVIRNTVLGDNNYLAIAKESSEAREIPTAESLTNANVTCQGNTSSLNVSSVAYPCSEGSLCLEGDVGVYCQCYLQRSSSEQRCVIGDETALNLTSVREPGVTFFPDMLEGDLRLSHGTYDVSSDESVVSSSMATYTTESLASSGVSSNSTSNSGVLWSVSALPQSVSGTSMMNWTTFPSSGLLLPGESITLRVVTLPSTSFDGTTSVTFVADGVGMNASSTRPPLVGSESGYDNVDEGAFDANNNYYDPSSTATRHAQLKSGTSSGSRYWNASVLDITSESGSNITSSASFTVTFYHCDAGRVWNPSTSGLGNNTDEDALEGCQLCGDLVEGQADGVECDDPGATIETLHVQEGYWRAALDVVVIRECSSEDACKGGSAVASVQEYCNDGYKGPECAVCSSGYGRGAANECHRCTASFKAGMYFFITIAAMFSLVVIALLAAYLVGGRRAVSSTMASTKESVLLIKRRGSVLLARSDAGDRIDFGGQSVSGRTRSTDSLGGGDIEMSRTSRTMRPSVRGSTVSSSGTGIDTSMSSNLEGGSGTGRAGGSLFSERERNDVGRVATNPRHSSVKTTGLASMVPACFAYSPSRPTPPAEEKRDTVVRDENHDNDSADASDTANYHLALASSIKRRPSTAELSYQRAFRGPPTTEVGLEDSTGSVEQPQLRRARAPGRPVPGRELGGPGRNRAQRQPRGEHKAEDGGQNRTAAVKIGNILAELPLSKLKIVIVVWQVSAAFSNITNVAYPPIYEKFLSIIAVFSFDLAWILSAACLTTEVNFYAKLLMVTIGPLVVLGLLGVTFHIGARPMRPVATNVPIVRQAHSRSQPDLAVLQSVDHLGSGPGLERARTSDTPAEDALQTPKPTIPGTVLQRSRHSGRSDDTVAFSPSEHPNTCPGASPSKHRNAASTSNYLLTLSRSRRPATAAGSSADRRHPPGEEQKISGTINPSASLDDATCNEQDRTKGNSRGEGMVEVELDPLASPVSTEGRFEDKSLRSFQSVLKAGPGNSSDPEQGRLWDLFARHTTMTLILLYLVYSQVSTVVFQTFSCEPFPEIGKSYLRADQRIECYTATHTAYTTYAAVMIFVYPLGIPAAFYFLLWRQGSSINPPTDNTLQEQRGAQYVVREKINQRSKDPSIAPTSFLWNTYYPNRYYFEVFECLRRLVLTGLLVFLVPDTPGQVAFSCVFAFACLMAFELQRPHIDALEIQLYRTGSLVIFFTNFLALMIKAEVADEHSTGSAVYSVVLVMVNIMFFLSIWWNTWATVKLTFTRRGFQGAVVGFDVVSEDALGEILGPVKKERRQSASHDDGAHGADANIQRAEQRPAWDETSGTMKECVDSSGSTRSGRAPLLP